MSRNYVQSAKEMRARSLALAKAGPGPMRALRQLAEEAMKPGALEPKTKELMALAIAIAVRCEGCIIHHAQVTHKLGATREEVVETIGVAIEMGGGPSAVYGGEALQAYDQFSAEQGR